jgi:regulator of protease activity HflC (stomatin/prohibitin superfamily)
VENLVDLLWNPVFWLVLINVLVLVSALPLGKTRFKWSPLFQLIVFDLTAIYILESGVPFWEMSNLTWIAAFFLLLWPLVLYWLGVAFYSIFLLPVELERWRIWFKTARAVISFARVVNFPYYRFNEESQELEQRLGGEITGRQGGLGIVLLRPEQAVVLYNGSELTRVAGGDVVFTERLERILELVDLRMHLMAILNVESVTKDGIAVKFHTFVPCRIDRAGASDQPERLYPFNENTVFQVVRGLDLVDGKKRAWYELVVQKTKKAASDVVATYVLDRLFTAEDPEQIPRDEVRARIQARLTAEMTGTGIEIIGVGIHNIVPVELEARSDEKEPVRVAEQRVSNWQARWQRRAAEREARGEAEAIRIVEQARGRALTELINAVEEGFREMAAHGNAARPEDVIALSFINAVEQMLARQQAQPNFLSPIDPLTTARDIRRLMQPAGEKQQEG